MYTLNQQLNLEPFLFFILVILPIVVALTCLAISFRYIKKTWILKDTPVSKIRSAAQGYVELQGRAQYLQQNTAITSLSALPCIWHQYFIEAWQSYQTEEGTTQSNWQLIETHTSNTPFLIEDGTGECVILPKGATIIPMHTVISYGYDRNPRNPQSRSFLGNFLQLFTSKTQYRYREYRIEVGDLLYVAASFITVNEKDSRVQQNRALKEYIQTQSKTTVNLLCNDNLPEKIEFLVSSLKESRVVQKYRFVAFMYFLAFLLFSAASASTVYPLVIKSHLLEFLK